MEVRNSTQDPATSILAVELSAMNLESDRELDVRLPAGIRTSYQGTHRCWGIFCAMYVVTGGPAAVLGEIHFSSVMNAMLRYIRRSSEDGGKRK